VSKRKPSGRPPFDPSRVKPDDEPGLFGPPPEEPKSPPKGDAPQLPAPAPKLYTVSDLNRMVKAAISAALPGNVSVLGELSNLSRPSGGHVYFTLKDASSEVRCVMWRSDAARLRFTPEDGMEVIVTGEVDVYEPRGQYQLYARRLEPRGVGALEIAFRQLKERLEREGLFDPARKRAIPAVPGRIAVVTSPTGAAIRDILQTIERRYPCVSIYVFPVKVQGDGAKEEIADAIARVNRSSNQLGGIDVMIVGRGGGSLEDLWAFNEELVARAIFNSEIPIVSAVGHEVDFTIADYVADLRAATPTAAAELVVPQLIDLVAGLDTQAHRLSRAALRAVESATSRLSMLERCEWFRDPLGRIGHRQQQLDEVTGRLRLAMSRRLSASNAALHESEMRLAKVRPEVQLGRRRELLGEIEHRLRWAQGHQNLKLERRLAAVESRLRVSSPMRLVKQGSLVLGHLSDRLIRGQETRLRDGRRGLDTTEARLLAASSESVLQRGYTITRSADGRLIRTPADTAAGDQIVTQTAGGEIRSRVESSDAQS